MRAAVYPPQPTLSSKKWGKSRIYAVAIDAMRSKLCRVPTQTFSGYACDGSRCDETGFVGKLRISCVR